MDETSAIVTHRRPQHIIDIVRNARIKVTMFISKQFGYANDLRLTTDHRPSTITMQLDKCPICLNEYA